MNDSRSVNGMDITSAQERRARNFSNQILSLLQDYLPRDRDCQRAISHLLMTTALANNLEIIQVPPELDQLNATELSASLLQTRLNGIGVKAPWEAKP